MKQIATAGDATVLGLDALQVWDTELAYSQLNQSSRLGQYQTNSRATLNFAKPFACCSERREPG